MKKIPWNHMERIPFHNWKQKVNSKSPIFPAVDGFRLIRLSLGAGCVWSLSCLRFLRLRSSWNSRATGQEIALDSRKWVWTLNPLKKMLSCKPVRNRDWKQLPLVGSEKTPPVTQQGVPAGNTQQQKAAIYSYAGNRRSGFWVNLAFKDHRPVSCVLTLQT